MTTAMIASHFRGEIALDEDIHEVIDSNLKYSKFETLTDKGELQIEFLKLLFNAQTVNLGKSTHEPNELRRVLKELPKLSTDLLTNAISWMKQQNARSEKPLDFCDCCNREGVDRMNPPMIGNIFHIKNRLPRRRVAAR